MTGQEGREVSVDIALIFLHLRLWMDAGGKRRATRPALLYPEWTATS